MMMVFSLACYKHAKGFGKCALLEVLQAFKIKKVVFPTWQTFGARPDDACPAALAKNKRFESSRNTWSDHVEKISAIPLNI